MVYIKFRYIYTNVCWFLSYFQSKIMTLLQWQYGRVMVFNITTNNISAISWPSVLLVEEIGVPGENH
jgi:predicted permease